jgi:hypothetical protein
MDTVLRGLAYESSCVPGRRDHDWQHVPMASAQPAENVPAVPRGRPKAQFVEVPIFSEGSTVPRA